jgi:hypothetical protein
MRHIEGTEQPYNFCLPYRRTFQIVNMSPVALHYYEFGHRLSEVV